MNSLNDLIHSHDMYNEFESVLPSDHASYQSELPSSPQTPPWQQHARPASPSMPSNQTYNQFSLPYHHTPYQPSHIENQQVQSYPQTPPQASSPSYPQHMLPSYQQTHARSEYDRQTIHAMMTEIQQIKRRLEVMMASCEQMIERTYISHEYHRALHYHEQISATQDRQYQQYQQGHQDMMSYPPLRNTIADQTPQPEPQPIGTKEGVFDGEKMISADGETYAVPPLFASKKKLIEGDLMHAMIYSNGHMKFKQADPITRENIMGILSTHAANSPYYIVQTAHKAYKVLKEAVDMHHGTPGNQILLIVPQGGESDWATIEEVYN